MCGGDVGLARYLSKVKSTCASPQSGTETLRNPQRHRIIHSQGKGNHAFSSFSQIVETVENSKSQKVKNLVF